MTGMAEDYLESRGGDKLRADIPRGGDARRSGHAHTLLRAGGAPSMTGAVLDINGASYVR